MSLLAFLIIGFLVGLVARAIMPGSQPMGLLATTALGIVGSFVGGLIATLIFPEQSWRELHTSGIVFSLAGALLVLAVVGFTGRERSLRA